VWKGGIKTFYNPIMNRMATTEEKETEIIRQFKHYMSDPENVILAANSVFE
jgi:hypothetical protein